MRNKIMAMLPSILRDVLPPTAAYYVLHALGAGDRLALLTASLVAGGLMVFETVRLRRLEIFSAVMLGVFGIGLVLSLISGDPRFMLVKESFGTAILGGAFLISCVVGKPLIYLAARRFRAGDPAKTREFEQLYDQNPAARRRFKALSLVWGAGLIVEAAVRVVLCFRLPIDTMVAVSPVLMIGTITLLLGLTARYVRRFKAAESNAQRGAEVLT
ncbi:VC0807 family protein [Amycolatopsis sp. NPDC059657]|uniref:VC0807 family protein n=1 Tax=Amycolatopsis sp. NPDC059657 TaxID=3346899 RepID=UPI0036729288